MQTERLFQASQLYVLTTTTSGAGAFKNYQNLNLIFKIQCYNFILL